ncbi:hypothetical protein OFB61_23245, partial [Escherichia coli]|nr:hypothetical protein [Escherichia coli]
RWVESCARNGEKGEKGLVGQEMFVCVSEYVRLKCAWVDLQRQVTASGVWNQRIFVDPVV